MSYYYQHAAADPPVCPGGRIYTIKAGDTLFSLARRFNTTVQAIITANPGLNPNALQIGEQICLPIVPLPPAPEQCPSGIIYRVQAGDTFYAIARRYNIAVNTLMTVNPGVNPNALQIGQQLCIPTPAPTPTITCPGPTYTVRPGDTFYGIARTLGFTVPALHAANPSVVPDNLQVGQILCLPVGGARPCPGGTIYFIQPGDTLTGIARKFDITLNALMAANPRLKGMQYIFAGEPLCIPIREI
jgi:peptidoglycan DL-endopeptidase LytF